MELIEIIRSTLIIFAGVSTIFLSGSYTVYKLRNRKNIKPYLKDEEFTSPIIILKADDAVEEVPEEPKKKAPRFHILNENLSVQKTAMANNSLPAHKLRQKPVISYYSFKQNEPLHKFRTSKFVDREA